MLVLSFLTDTASSVVLSTAEQLSVTTSIITLQSRTTLYSDSGVITQHSRFGFSTQGMILSRSMDGQSDTDYMMISGDGSATPQTYLDRLRAFVEKWCDSSEIYQSSPTIVLRLNRTKFDLMPTTKAWLGELRIPNGSGGQMATNLNDFNATLEAKNKDNNSLTKLTIRLMKYWNVVSRFPFDLLAMGKWTCGQGFWFQPNQKDYLFSVIDNLSTDSSYSQRINNKTTRAKTIVAKVRQHEKDQMLVTAENEVEELFRL